ncbi:hydroxyacylglutathione hydrolase [Novosphingobium sp. 1949]|uniref:Hydroxyacylglutathione hydrolase n=1 Tax=Novosphingobium organovorum TaxID=2930092 RepID=A0ABT0B908_9SPHN|nr:hydroxyacylglutathione hydrolase [Novosphingobium organovorum]MCJ2181350.1 hydroxyacylglutathione hydrolase [Novosphingobium organovorum]
MLEVHQFPCLSDNYGYLLHDSTSGETVCIDTPDADEYLKQAGHKGWQITQIWNTHWHKDHAGGNRAIKAATGCTITAPQGDAARIEGVDRTVSQGDIVTIGEREAKVLDVGGHTLGHCAYWLAGARMAFVGDSVFALGCGRMFEGTPPQFWRSLERLKALPEETMLYCAHEYTEANLRFALHADPDNAQLAAYATDIARLRAEGLPTVPTKLERELATNPFLRADDPAMEARWGHPGDAVATFAALRTAKDSF